MHIVPVPTLWKGLVPAPSQLNLILTPSHYWLCFALCSARQGRWAFGYKSSTSAGCEREFSATADQIAKTSEPYQFKILILPFWLGYELLLIYVTIPASVHSNLAVNRQSLKLFTSFHSVTLMDISRCVICLWNNSKRSMVATSPQSCYKTWNRDWLPAAHSSFLPHPWEQGLKALLLSCLLRSDFWYHWEFLNACIPASKAR